ncbi:MAG: hypothetical protein RBS57_12330 [Desulforhabdus sp.]|jgi:hypothetical protein|nr:hypothetical protein [Desulforhabdus sp.]
MTHGVQSSAMDTAMQVVGEQGFDGMAQAMARLLNMAMEAEKAA